MKRRSLARLGLHPNPSAVALHDFFADSQANARAVVPAAFVQSFEDSKYTLMMKRVYADAVVDNGKEPARFLHSAVFAGYSATA